MAPPASWLGLPIALLLPLLTTGHALARAWRGGALLLQMRYFGSWLAAAYSESPTLRALQYKA